MVLYTVYSTERRHNILTGSGRTAILIVYHSSVHGFKRGGAGHAVGCGWLFSSRLRLWGSHCQYNVARRCPPLRLIWFFAGGCRADAPPPPRYLILRGRRHTMPPRPCAGVRHKCRPPCSRRPARDSMGECGGASRTRWGSRFLVGCRYRAGAGATNVRRLSAGGRVRS